MRKFVVVSSIISIVILALVVLYQSGIMYSLLVFLLVGAVPGTSIELSPNVMMIVGAAILWAIIINLTVIKLVNFMTTKRMVDQHLVRRQRMPRRRYSRI